MGQEDLAVIPETNLTSETSSKGKIYEIEPGDFAQRVIETSGVELQKCYQCQKCSSGCVLAPYMDFLPHQVVKMIQLGQKKELLGSKGIWLCATCYTCTVRCPNEVDVSGLMDALRRMTSERDLSPEACRALNFHKVFLSSIKYQGRIYELGMLGHYKLKQKDLFSDLKLAWKLFRRGKLNFLPPFIRGRRNVRKIFSAK